jgi:Protein of unknown function (DUF4242)
MPRYLVQRTFDDGLRFVTDEVGVANASSIIDANSDHQVTWVQSFVSDDDRTTWCVYDAPSPEAIRSAARCNGLPVDVISSVRVLDPYFYRSAP